MTRRKFDDKSKAAANPKRSTSLDGKTVLVTRPRTQSGEITRLLEERGAIVVHGATIEITPPSSWEAVDQAITTIESYDWLVFTSANGAQFFFDRFAEVPDRVFRPPTHLSICAIGPATAKAIEAAGARVDLVVRESTAEGVLREIIERVGSQLAIRGLRFLLPGARQARDFLPVELRRLGAKVDAVEAYQTVKPNVDIGSLFELHNISVITFTSPSTVSNFATLVGADLLAVLRKDTLVACIGSVTAAAAAEQGFKRIVQAESANAHALVEAIVKSVADE